MAPVYDYACPVCDKEFEKIGTFQEAHGTMCPECGSFAGRTYRPGGTNTANEDAPWIRSVLEVVAKDSDKEHTRRFLAEPTRENYKKWMKGEGIRHLEPGEKAVRPTMDIKRHTDKVMEMRQKRNRIEIGG